MSTFTDYASHATSFAYSSGKLTSVTLTDPDAGGSQAAPVWTYGYDATTALLETQTNPNSDATDFTYDATSLSRVDFPTGTDHTLLTPRGAASSIRSRSITSTTARGTLSASSPTRSST